eukprot:CAMPEP_0185030868 /NCGR_PEP_ID=MMETSP1103-20130426/17980_1 /TAXON_ID=36769 /ORGANISM="Paraphysomonas bandaiensis, Strain Caron Lab Isolate" /LENGTH=318 /DNA_ID=CAMNT_0027566157 /DNA_START=72 /DNA_END=1028 /DNA_ORIENTATION=-
MPSVSASPTFTPVTTKVDWGISVGNQGTTVIYEGDSVTWDWIDNLSHSVHSLGTTPENSFSSSVVESGEGHSYTVRFNNAGIYPYDCSVHSSMTGQIEVVARTPNPTSSPPSFSPTTSAPTSSPPTGMPSPAPSPTPTAAPTNMQILPWGVDVGDQGKTSVAVGDYVMWNWSDELPHDVTSTNDTTVLSSYQTFESSNVMTGSSNYYIVQFNSEGSYIYYCSVHPTMKGVIVVGDDTTTNNEKKKSDDDTSGLGVGAIVGISIAAFFGLLLLVGGMFAVRRRSNYDMAKEREFSSPNTVGKGQFEFESVNPQLENSTV